MSVIAVLSETMILERTTRSHAFESRPKSERIVGRASAWDFIHREFSPLMDVTCCIG